MARSTIESLPLPPKRFRPSLQLRDFETMEDAQREDVKRSRSLKANKQAFPQEERATIKKLRKHLEGEDMSGIMKSLASSRDTRDVREAIGGNIAEYFERHDITPEFYTVAPRTWRPMTGALHTVSAYPLMHQWKSDLQRGGSKKADGGLISFLDGEYDPATERYQLHIHAVVWGGMVGVVEGLRKRKKYRYDRNALEKGIGAVHPIHRRSVKRTPLSCYTYLLKSFWPQKPTMNGSAFGLSEGLTRRAHTKHRIAEPQHSEVLLWLHREQPADMCLTMKVRPTPNGFR